jgi:hypothetical protein
MSENKRKIPEHPFYSNPDAYGQNEKMPKVSEKTTEQRSVTSAKEWRKAQNIQGVTTDGTWAQFSTDVLDQLLEAYASSRLAEVTALIREAIKAHDALEGSAPNFELALRNRLSGRMFRLAQEIGDEK